MRRYLRTAFVTLIACTIALTSCDRTQKAITPIMPETETERQGEVLIYTNRSWWITLEDAAIAAETTKSLLEAKNIQVQITKDGETVKEWMLQTTGNGNVDVIVLYGVLPASIYAPGNTQPDGSIAENWIETTDGDTILNHADYIAFNADSDVNLEWEGQSANGSSGLRQLMDNPIINLFSPLRGAMIPTSDGIALTPSLIDFTSHRPIPLGQLQGEWFAEKIFASDTGDDQASYADPVIVRDGDRGRLAIVYAHATDENHGYAGFIGETRAQAGLLHGKVAAEIIANYLIP